MSSAMKIQDHVDFAKATRNPFAKIARAARENNGELSESTSKQMMKEAISELRAATAEQENK